MAHLGRLNVGATLTARQEEVAYLIGFGLSRKEAAARLRVSYKTIDNEVQQVYARIGANKMTELTIFCFCRRFKIPVSSLMLMTLLFYTVMTVDIDMRCSTSSRTRAEVLRNSGRRAREDYVY